MAATVRQVGERAGVAVSTASIVLNGKERLFPISAETKARVMAAADELGYAAGARRGRRKRRTDTIGCVFAAHLSLISDPILAPVLDGIGSALDEQGYDLLLSGGYEAIDERLLHAADKRKVDGLLYFFYTTTYDDFQHKLAREPDAPTVPVMGMQFFERHRGGRDIVVRDCEVTQVRGRTAVSGTKVDGMVIERVHVHNNPGHTKGVVLHTCRNSAVRDCLLERNTSTALDYYVTADSEVIGCRVRENKGSHANGLTFYVGCKNILVARNHVSDGNVALTFQEGEGFVFRNNLLEGNGKTPTIGIWTAPPLKDVQFINNTIVRGNPKKPHAVGLFANAPKIQGLVVRNNIIDGVFSDHDVFRPGTFSHNLYTRIGKDQGKDGVMGEHERVETDLSMIFVDHENGDWRLRPGSPAIGMGADLGVELDFTDEARPDGGADVGAYAHR